MDDFFDFRKMISTNIIEIVYVLGIAALIVGGFILVSKNSSEMVLIGVSTIIIGNLLWRLICEGWILLFSIHEVLVVISKGIAPVANFKDGYRV